MTSSQDQDGPSGHGHGLSHGHEQASTPTPTPTPMSTSAFPPTATSTASSTANAHAPPQRDGEGDVDHDPSANPPNLEVPESTNNESNDPFPAKEPASGAQDGPLNPAALNPAALDQVIASQYSGHWVNHGLSEALFGPNADRSGLGVLGPDSDYYAPTHLSTEEFLDACDNPRPLPQSVSHQQLLALSGWEPPSNVGFPTYDQDEDLESDQDEEEQHAYNSGIFGKLELPDTVFWITTRAVLIGRDVKLYKHARQEHEYRQKAKSNLENGLVPPEAPPAARRKYQTSYVSEEGGALGPVSDDDEEPRPAKRRKTTAAGKAFRQQRDTANAGPHVISSRQYFDNTRPVDVNTLQPSSEVVARLNIHGSGQDYSHIYRSTKGISRDHLRVQYNSDKRVWEAVVLGRNGLFLRDSTQAVNADFDHHAMGEVVTLRSGDFLQIQNLPITFTLTGVEHGKTGAEVESTYSENGKEMSFDFQSSRGEEMRDTDDSSDGPEVVPGDEQADRAEVDSDDSDDSDEEMDDAPSPDKAGLDDGNNGDTEEIRETVESDPPDENLKPEPSAGDAEALAQVPLPPKKRGPGRPPKNGIMSKREERLLKKQAQEEAKKNMPPQEPGEQPQKRKVGRPRKHPLPEDGDGQAEKRKYKPRKSKGEDGEEDPDGEKPAKEKSQKHKTPPLELKREDFTEEQLQKPTKNYQMLIDDIMSAAPPKGYSLKQVYKRIQERWPFFYFCVDTKGWESSVRHNLLGSECFKKIDGNWHRVPGVPLESGKKRKPSDSTAEPRPAAMYNGYSHPYQPPPHAPPHGHQPMPHSTGLSQPNLPPRYPPNGQAYQIHQGPTPNTAQPGGAPNQQGPPRPGFPQHQTPLTTPQTNGYTAAGVPPRPHYQGTQPPSYSSVYANRPQPPHVAAPGPAPAAGQNPAQRPPMTRPGQGPPGMPQHSLQTSHMDSPSVARPVPPPSSQQSVATGAAPAPPGPVIDHVLRTFIREFRAEVIKQLQAKEGKRSEAVAMSVINRGLGLTDRSLVPECEAYEKLILNVFHQHKKTYPKLRAEEAARAASASFTTAASVKATSVNDNGSVAAATSRAPAPAPAANPTTTTPTPASGVTSTAPIANEASAVNGQANKSVAATGPATTAGVNGPTNRGAIKVAPDTTVSAGPKPTSTGPTPSTSMTAGPGIPTPACVGPASSAPTTTTSGTLGGVCSGPVSSPPAPAGSGASASASTSAPLPAPVTASLTTPKPVSAGPMPSASATAESAGAVSVSTSPAPSVSATRGPAVPKTVPAESPPSASAASSAPTHTSSVIVPSVSTTNGATLSRPTSAGPAPGAAVAGASGTARPLSGGCAPSATATAAPANPRPAGASGAPNVTPVVGSTNGGAVRPATSTGASAASVPTPIGLRAASTTPGTPTTPDDSKDVELLDPKLVTVILSFKKAILPTLAEKLDLILGESLIMSAVDRMLGFTDDTFVHTKTEQQQKNLAEAEKALMKHLETRFHEYLRTRSASR